MEKTGTPDRWSQKDCSPNNTAYEGLLGRMINEFFYNQEWMDTGIEEFSHELDLYLYLYNEKRIKKSLEHLSPAAYKCSLGLVV